MTTDLRAGFTADAFARILDHPPRPTPVDLAVLWQACAETVQQVRAGYDPGSLEERALGEAYRAILGLDVDSTWTDLLADRDKRLTTARELAAEHTQAGAGAMVAERFGVKATPVPGRKVAA